MAEDNDAEAEQSDDDEELKGEVVLEISTHMHLGWRTSWRKLTPDKVCPRKWLASLKRKWVAMSAVHGTIPRAGRRNTLEQKLEKKRQQRNRIIAKLRQSLTSEGEQSGRSSIVCATKKHEASPVADRCYICRGRHVMTQCPFVPIAFWTQATSTETEVLRVAHGAPEVVVIPKALVEKVSVAPDGHCLFASVLLGLKAVCSDKAPDSCTALRKKVVDYVCDHPTMAHNEMTHQEWVQHAYHWSMETYKHEMSKVTGLRRSSWGSAFETGIMANMFSVSIRTFEEVQEGFELISEAHPVGIDRASDGFQRSLIFILWNGLHYDFLRQVLQ